MPRPPRNIVPFPGGAGVHLMHDCMGHPSPHCKQHLDWFRRFITGHCCVQLADRQTDTEEGCSPKKRSGGRLKQDLDKAFKQFRPTYTYTHTRQKNCHSGSLVLSCDTATRV